jgi:uncharacterized membrane protein YraQ (UPF0718 family)
MILTTLLDIVLSCWEIFVEAAPYMLFGFFAAGLLKGLIPDDAIARHLGDPTAKSVIKASLLGIPLPLCSCGVIPAAIGLRQQGASKGASAAFLVSTPESGVDSIAVTWALLDPVMTIFRPLSALITATITGLLINRLPEEEVAAPEEIPVDCCATENCGDSSAHEPPTRGQRVKAGLKYAFGELLSDIGGWLLLGIAVAGVIEVLTPDDFFIRFLGSEFLSLLIMLVVGIPLYICASASTPIAAALVLKGLSPGAALVFLLAGPATNAATITIIGRFWGKRATAVYLATISVCSLVLGWLLNRLYAHFGWDITRWISDYQHADSPWMIAAALVLAGLLVRSWWLKKISPAPGGG